MMTMLLMMHIVRCTGVRHSAICDFAAVAAVTLLLRVLMVLSWLGRKPEQA